MSAPERDLLPARHQLGDVVSFCRDKKVKERHRMCVEVVGITFTETGIFYDIEILDKDGAALGAGPLLMVDAMFLFPLVPSNIH